MSISKWGADMPEALRFRGWWLKRFLGLTGPLGRRVLMFDSRFAAEG